MSDCSQYSMICLLDSPFSLNPGEISSNSAQTLWMSILSRQASCRGTQRLSSNSCRANGRSLSRNGSMLRQALPPLRRVFRASKGLLRCVVVTGFPSTVLVFRAEISH